VLCLRRGVLFTWTFLVGALLATVLTTESDRVDRDGEAFWLPWVLSAVWLAGIALLVLFERRHRP
jgi:hypothetical protein